MKSHLLASISGSHVDFRYIGYTYITLGYLKYVLRDCFRKHTLLSSSGIQANAHTEPHKKCESPLWTLHLE